MVRGRLGTFSRRSSKLVSSRSCLHDKQRKLSPWEEADPNELCDVWVVEAGHQLALLQVLANHLRHSLIFHIQESFMYSLSSTDDLLVCDLWRERCQGDGERFDS